MPLIARWPGHVPAGKVSPELFCLTDVLADVGRLTEAWAILGPLAEHWSSVDGASSGPIEGPDPEVVAVALSQLTHDLPLQKPFAA